MNDGARTEQGRAGNLGFAAVLAVAGAALVPLQLLYARALEPAAFGRIALLIALASAASYVFTLGLEGPILRGLAQHRDDASRRAAHLRALERTLLVAVALLIGCAVLGLAAGAALGAVSGFTLLVVIDLAAAGTITAVTTVPYMVFRVEGRLRAFAATVGAVALGQVAFRSVLLATGHAGVGGWVLGDVFAAAAVVVAVRVFHRRERANLPLMPFARAGLDVGLPLVPNAVGQWSLMVADRPLVDHFAGRAALGVYQAGYALPQATASLLGEINRAVMRAYAGLHERDEDRKRDALGCTVGAHVVTIVAAGIAVAAVARVVIGVMLPHEYQAARSIAPVVAAGYVFFGLYQIPMNLLTIIEGRTARVWPITWAAAGVGFVIDIAVLRHGDAMPAAVATLVSYVLLFAGVTAHYLRVHTVSALPPARVWLRWPLRHLAVLGAGAAVLCAGACLGGTADTLSALVAVVCAVVAVGGRDGALLRLHRAGRRPVVQEAIR